MQTAGSVRRRVATWATALALAAAGLGLVAPPPAGASCAGPQLALEQVAAPIAPRRVGEGDEERTLYDVRQDQPLVVVGSNLTLGCQDTYSSTQGGCGSPVPDPVEPSVPLDKPDILLRQGGGTWTLARGVTIGSDLTARVSVDLPDAVRPGFAQLSLLDRKDKAEAQLNLVIT